MNLSKALLTISSKSLTRLMINKTTAKPMELEKTPLISLNQYLLSSGS
jgi:hypothetical protein